MGYYITIKNQLLEQKHYEAMGAAVWLYMWLIDKVMAINEAGLGRVYNGKPVVYEEIQATFGMSERTYYRYIAQLRAAGYIRTVQAPYGLIISVTKADKMWGAKSKDNNAELFADMSPAKNGRSKELKGSNKKAERTAKNGRSALPKMAGGSAKNGSSNKDNNTDNSNNNIVTNVTIGAKAPKTPSVEIDDLFMYWQLTTGYQIQAKVRANRYACSNLIKRFTVEGVKKLVDGAALAQADRYAPSVSDFCELQSNLNRLIAWGKKRQPTKGVEI